MTEQNVGQGREPHTQDGTRPSTRRRVTTVATGVIVGGFLEFAGSIFPRSSLGTQLVDHITFLPQKDTRFALGTTLKTGGNATIIYAIKKGTHIFEKLAAKKRGVAGALFDSNGLTIEPFNNKSRSSIAIEYGLPLDNMVLGRIDFMPDGRTVKAPDRTSFDMLRLITSLQEYFTGIDEGKYPKPEFLYGTTNKLMAMWASDRLGFICYYYPENPKTNYRVVGETKVVRKLLEELTAKTDSKGRTIVDKLTNRTPR